LTLQLIRGSIIAEEHYFNENDLRPTASTNISRQQILGELKDELGLVDMLFRELALYKQECVCKRAEILTALAENGSHHSTCFFLSSPESDC